MSKQFISCTLPYSNASPHVGHLLEFLLGDTIARYYRSIGVGVLFNVGVDEHGQKIYDKAISEGLTPQGFCDIQVEKWITLCKHFYIGYDNFYRTSSATHAKNVADYYNDISYALSEKLYKGKYCIGCESFITETESVDGTCPTHGTLLTPVSEINIFFELSKFKDRVKDVLVDKTLSAELKNIIEDTFDFSISRRNKNVKWGIPINDAEDADVYYCWAEALLNYIFAAGYTPDINNREIFNGYWKNSLIICGKDNLKFQAFILQALLLASGTPQTKKILVHGTILDSNGNKMSKSVGNVIDPIEQYEKYGLTAVRYYTLVGLSTFSNSCWDEAELVKLYTSHLVNGYGNLMARTLHLIDIKNVEPDDKRVTPEFKAATDDYISHIEADFSVYNIRNAGQKLHDLVSYGNKYITDARPFDAESTNYVEVLNNVYHLLDSLTSYYSLIIPNMADELQYALASKKKSIIFPRI